MINKVIASRYKILEKVGIGGMAEVYKAQDEVLGRIDAVKVLLPQFASDPTFAARFRQEAKAAANLSSPYIVSIYDWGLDGETYYIVMEFVRGVDLKTAIAQRGSIDQRKVAQIASQICAGLTEAHQNDVIHRDIKPQNIMVQPDGNIKIMDFGVARAGNSTMTQTGSVLGTANYVSPEQAQGKTPTAESDIYSLGILMYEAVTGKPPFEGGDAISVALKQVNEIPVPPSVHNPAIDPDFEAIILKAIEKDPANRFESANEMRAALSTYLNGGPVSLGGAATTQVLDASADKTAILESDTTTVRSVGSSKQSSTPAKKKSNKKRNIIIAVCCIAAVAIIGCLLALGMLGGSSEGTVPSVVGLTQAEAEEAIEEAGYTVGEITNDYSSEYDEGVVMKQSPEGNTRAASGATINLVISRGAPPANQVSVPDLTGLTVEEATEQLAALNLQCVSGNAVSSTTVQIGNVAEQDVAAGTLVDEGSTITIYTSSGTTIPTVVGMTESEAISAIESAGLTASVTRQETSSYEAGTVISVSPSAGQAANPGTTVTITVAEAAEPEPTQVTVPSVVGEDVDTAISSIESAGLRYNIRYDTSGSASDGTVISTSPSAGQTVNEGATITLVVAQSEEEQG